MSDLIKKIEAKIVQFSDTSLPHRTRIKKKKRKISIFWTNKLF